MKSRILFTSRQVWLLAGALLALLAPRGVSETLEVPCIADAYVRDMETADVPKALALAARGQGNNRKIYLAFDIGNAVPYGKKITFATLRLWMIQIYDATQPLMPVGVYGIADNKDKWDKGAITWASAPKNNPESGTAFAPEGVASLGVWNIDLDKHAPPNTFGPEEFTSPQLAEFLNWSLGKASRPVPDASISDDDKVVTLLLAPEQEKSALVIFASGEAGTPKARPTLILEVE